MGCELKTSLVRKGVRALHVHPVRILLSCSLLLRALQAISTSTASFLTVAPS